MKILIIVLISFNLLAIDTFITLGLFSYHFQKKDDRRYNENHKTLGIEFYFDERHSISYLDFYNSNYQNSKILTVGKSYNLYKDLKARINIGIQKGYCKNFSEWKEGQNNTSLVLLPSLSYRYKNWLIDFIPPVIEVTAIKISYKIFNF